MSQCDNCGQMIGKLESPNLWQGHKVCHACFSRLASEATARKPLKRSTAQQVELAGIVGSVASLPLSALVAVCDNYFAAPAIGAGFVGTVLFVLLFLIGRIIRSQKREGASESRRPDGYTAATSLSMPENQR